MIYDFGMDFLLNERLLQFESSGRDKVEESMVRYFAIELQGLELHYETVYIAYVLCMLRRGSYGGGVLHHYAR